MPKIGEFNLGIRTDDTVQLYFDDKQLAYYFQGKLPNNFVWIRAMRQYTANQKKGENQRYHDAATFSNALHNRYGFEIHVHAYFINKIIPQFLKHNYGDAIKRGEEYKEWIEKLRDKTEQLQVSTACTQGTNIGKMYNAKYEDTRRDYDSLVKEWQEVVNKYQKEMQELNRLATNAHAVIFTISIYSDLKIVPDNDVAAKLALTECINELNTRHNSLVNDSIMQMFELRTVMQPYFFFMTEISGMFNPVIMAAMAKDPYFFELYKGMFPHINAASTLQTNLENMRHLSSYAPSDILRKMLLQMELVTKTFIPPQEVVAPQSMAQAQSNEPPPRVDYLKDGALIGHDMYGRDVRIPFHTLRHHIMIEGTTGTGKSTFGKVLASKAIEEAKMKVIVMDTGYRWTTLVKRYDGIIFDTKLNAEEALKHPYSVCIAKRGDVEAIESNFLEPFIKYIVQTREKKMIHEKDILLIIDEAHNFTKKLRQGTLVDIASEILKHGVIVTLITQRDERVGVDVRTQTSLQFNTQLSHQFIGEYTRTYKKWKAEAMTNIGEFNLYVHGLQIKRDFEMKPLEIYDTDMITDENMVEYDRYRYKPKEEPPQPQMKVEPVIEKKEPVPPIPDKLQEPTQMPATLPVKDEKPKEEPKPWPQKESPKTKPEEPQMPKEDPLIIERARMAIERIKANNGVFKSENKLFKNIVSSGDSTKKVTQYLVDNGYVTIDPNSNPKVYRLTDKGKSI